MSRITVDRELHLAALSDAIDWTEDLIGAQEGTPDMNTGAEERLARYLTDWQRITGRPYHSHPVDTARSVPIDQLPPNEHMILGGHSGGKS